MRDNIGACKRVRSMLWTSKNFFLCLTKLSECILLYDGLLAAANIAASTFLYTFRLASFPSDGAPVPRLAKFSGLASLGLSLI